MMMKERKREREKKTHEESEIKIQICKNSKKQTCVGEYLILVEGRRGLDLGGLCNIRCTHLYICIYVRYLF